MEDDPMDITAGKVASSDISKLIIYYTDFHNVDEDVLTAYYLGGSWDLEDSVGISYRNTDSTPSNSLDSVASVKKINRTYSPFGDACFSFDKG